MKISALQRICIRCVKKWDKIKKKDMITLFFFTREQIKNADVKRERECE